MNLFFQTLTLYLAGMILAQSQIPNPIKARPDNFVTTGLNKVLASKSSFLKELEKENWPKFKMLPALKKLGGPTSVWKSNDGYFCAVERGKLPGILCYAENDSLELIPLSVTEKFGVYVSQIVKVDEKTYVASGGNPDMNVGSGALLMIKMEKDYPVLKHRVYSRTNAGVPQLLGLSKAMLGAGPPLAVYSISGHENENEQVYGISNDGSVHHLGKYSEKLTKRDAQELQQLIDADKEKEQKKSP